MKTVWRRIAKFWRVCFLTFNVFCSIFGEKKNPVSGIRDKGLGIRDQGSRIKDQGSRIRDQGSGNSEQESEN